MNKKKNKIFVSGNFNILHPGHIRLLKFAKSLGKVLVVGVTSDKLAGKAAYIKQNHRINNIKNLDFVQKVILVRSLKSTILNEKPNIIVKGKEFRYQTNIEEELTKKINAELVFSSGNINYSSENLLKNELFENQIKFHLAKDFIKRKKINIPKMINNINKIKKLRVCVVGDVIIDEYINSNVLGASNEEPCLVLNPISSEKYIGGAGIVASHFSSLGAKTYLFSSTGKDQNSKFIEKELKKNNVRFHLYKDIIRPTTLKQRFKVRNSSLARVSYLSEELISIKVQNKIFNSIKKLIKKIDVLVFSDFNYGCLPQNLVDRLIKICKENKVLISADSQSSSQIGDISRFKNTELITPTEKEARISLKSNNDGLVVLSTKLQKLSGSKNIILTLNAEGILVFNMKNKKEYSVDRLPALNNNPKDVSGAGDSLLVMSTAFLAIKSNIWEAALAGTLFASLQSSTIGNQPIKFSEAKKLMKKLQK